MSIYKSGPETCVNDINAAKDQDSNIVALKDGGWLVTWTSRQPSGESEILQQRYDRDGKALWANNRTVNITTNGNQSDPQVTVLADGGWVVTWTSPDGNSDGIYQQRYDSNGQALWQADQRVNITTTGTQYLPDVAALADGGWVVTWTLRAPDNSDFDTYQQRFSSSGTAVWDTDRLLSKIATDHQWASQVAALPDGGWIASFSSVGADGSTDILQQRFNAAGEAQWPSDRIVNSTIPRGQDGSDIAILSNGGWVITWYSTGQDGNLGIYQKAFAPDGTPLFANDVRVNATTGGDQKQASVAPLANGGWVVVWASGQADGVGIYQQVYDSTGRPSSPVDLVVNITTSGSDPAVTALADGSWVVTWTTSDGIQTDIHQQRFEPNRAPADITLVGNTVREGATGALVGDLSGTDANLGGGDALTYTLLDDAGGRFLLDGSRIFAANGVAIDYEQAQAHQIRVRATDKDGLGVERALTIKVSDVTGETLTATEASERLVGGIGTDIFMGLGGNDTLIGGSDNDRLDGGTDQDLLRGGAGNDRLSGGKGRDIFVFDTKPNRKTNLDKITDFNVKDDTIWLENSYFKKLGKGSEAKPGTLKKAFFTIGAKAKDKNDYIIYDKAKGVLLYDQDGSGSKAAVAFATIKKGLGLKATDFMII